MVPLRMRHFLQRLSVFTVGSFLGRSSSFSDARFCNLRLRSMLPWFSKACLLRPIMVMSSHVLIEHRTSQKHCTCVTRQAHARGQHTPHAVASTDEHDPTAGAGVSENPRAFHFRSSIIQSGLQHHGSSCKGQGKSGQRAPAEADGRPPPAPCLPGEARRQPKTKGKKEEEDTPPGYTTHHCALSYTIAYTLFFVCICICIYTVWALLPGFPLSVASCRNPIGLQKVARAPCMIKSGGPPHVTAPLGVQTGKWTTATLMRPS